MSADSFDADWPSQILEIHALVRTATELLIAGKLEELSATLRTLTDHIDEIVDSIPEDEE